LLGKKALRGSGSGGDPIIGKLSVEESINDIHNVLENTDILFIIAGLGKGTGSGASPEIAKIARSLGILTVAIINFPSVNAEGRQVYENALNSFNILKNEVDAITKISNDKIILNDRSISFTLALEHANSEVTNVVGNIVNMIDSASNINLDFADVTNFFKNNKTFMSGNFELKENYSFDALKEIINHNIKASYCDMNLQTENCKLLMNLNINTNVPSSVTHDLRNIFKDITSDQSPSLIYGIDYTNVDGIKASFLMSANEQECIVNEIPSNALKHNENVSGDINEIFTNEAFINLDESMNEIENKTSGVKHENIKLATEEILIDEATSSNNRIDSLTTQVINDVLNPNNQTAKFTKKYN
jgi:cell division protein FtsZ